MNIVKNLYHAKCFEYRWSGDELNDGRVFRARVFDQNFLRFLPFRHLLVHVYIVYICWITFGDKPCILCGALGYFVPVSNFFCVHFV